MTSEVFFDYLEKQYSDKLPFVAYKKPNQSKVKVILQSDDLLHCSNDFSESGFVFAPFDDTEDAILIPTNSSKALEIEISEASRSYLDCELNSNNEVTNLVASTKHLDLVKKAITAISSTILKKVVLSRREAITLKNDNPINIFKKLLQSYASAFVYIWYHPKVGLWLGATPETLLGIVGNNLSTMALAGTQSYKGTPEVVWGDKEKEEQQMVTDFVIESLQSSVKDIHVVPVETAKAGNLLHLKTKITGRMHSQSTLLGLVKSLHPTPAICGLPREAAKQFIIENEGYKRGYYTGFLGELNVKETTSRNRNRRNVENNAYNSVKSVTNLFVNLRCMQIIEGEAYIYVGGGITKDSIPDSEWEETINKANTMKKVL